MGSSERPSLDPAHAEARFAELLDEADLPRFDSAFYNAEARTLELTWDSGLTVHVDLTRDDIEPLVEWERNAILGGPLGEVYGGPIDVTVAGSSEDPRMANRIPGLKIRRVPELHPQDVTVHEGIPVTSPSRTLIDLAECMTIDELRAAFARAQELDLLDPDALRAARARVEWRPSLAMLDEVIAESCD